MPDPPLPCLFQRALPSELITLQEWPTGTE
jgi:hypothetical protein